MSESSKGMKKGLTSYGDSGFSLFLRKAFIKGAGYTDDALDRPIVGIANTATSWLFTREISSASISSARYLPQ